MDQKRVKQILDRLPQLVVELDPDPTSRGPAYLQKAIFTTRSYLNETGVMIQEVLRYLGVMENDLNDKETLFQIRSDELMAVDERVKGRPAVRDREAMINVIERKRRAEILKLSQRIRDAQHLEKAIRHRHRELEHTMSAIRLQRSLIQTELRTGSFYGDESNDGSDATWGRQPPKNPELDESSLEAIFNSELAEGSPSGSEDEEGPPSDEEETVEEVDEGSGDEEVDEGSGDEEVEEPEAEEKVVAESPKAKQSAPVEDSDVSVEALMELADLDLDVNLDDNPPPEPKTKGKKAKEAEPKPEPPKVEQDLDQFDGDATLIMGESVLDSESTPDADDAADPPVSEEEAVDPAITKFLDGGEEDDDDLTNIFDEV